jgi:hypothetical protein
VVVIVDEPRYDGAALEIDRARAARGRNARDADLGESIADDTHRFDDRVLRAHRVDAAVR